MNTSKIESAVYQSLRLYASDGEFTIHQCRVIGYAVAAGIAKGIEEYKQFVDHRQSKAQIEMVYRYTAGKAWRTMRIPKWQKLRK